LQHCKVAAARDHWQQQQQQQQHGLAVVALALHKQKTPVAQLAAVTAQLSSSSGWRRLVLALSALMVIW
jgi:hypothetical protein